MRRGARRDVGGRYRAAELAGGLMGLTFQMLGVYAAPAPASDFTYLFAAEQQPAGGPWIGAFGYAKQDQGSPGPNLPLTGWLFAEIASGKAFSNLGIVILPQAPEAAG